MGGVRQEVGSLVMVGKAQPDLWAFSYLFLSFVVSEVDAQQDA